MPSHGSRELCSRSLSVVGNKFRLRYDIGLRNELVIRECDAEVSEYVVMEGVESEWLPIATS
jgi:hypothetical protein